MNDMMPTIEETIDLNDIAQHEHEQWLRGCEREERWEAAEATHGPLLTKADLENYHKDMTERDAAFENAYKCDDDEDDHDSMNDGHGTLADDAWHDANEYPEW